MEKLEKCFKEVDDDMESGLFRQHFKQTIENLSVLAKLGKTVEPFDDRHFIQMPPLKDPSKLAPDPRDEDDHFRSGRDSNPLQRRSRSTM